MRDSILLVDDEPDIVETLQQLLEMEFPGHDVLMAPDGPTALEMMDERMPILVVSDFRMPSMNGLDFLRAAHEKHGAFPAVLLTAYNERENAVRAAQEGTIRRFYMKPPDVDAVLAGIRELVDPSAIS